MLPGYVLKDLAVGSDFDMLTIVFQLLPVEVDPAHLQRQPLIDVCSLATKINRDEKVFDVDAIQYVAAMKDLPRESSVFPFHAYFLDNAQFGKNKPIPGKDTYVHAGGLLTCLGVSPTGVLDRFYVELDQLSFLGKKGFAPLECEYPDTSDASEQWLTS